MCNLHDDIFANKIVTTKLLKTKINSIDSDEAYYLGSEVFFDEMSSMTYNLLVGLGRTNKPGSKFIITNELSVGEKGNIYGQLLTEEEICERKNDIEKALDTVTEIAYKRISYNIDDLINNKENIEKVFTLSTELRRDTDIIRNITKIKSQLEQLKEILKQVKEKHTKDQ